MSKHSWKHGGLNHKEYIVRKACEFCGGSGRNEATSLGMCLECSGSGLEETEGKFFVLRIDLDAKGEPYDPHARFALQQYARSVYWDNPQLANDIENWLYETN